MVQNRRVNRDARPSDTPTLRIEPAGSSHFTLAYLKPDGTSCGHADVSAPSPLTPEDYEAIRWYLEEYRQFPFEPATAVANRTATRIRELGENMFIHLFGASGPGQAVWGAARDRINATRIEIVGGVGRFSFPWEILWNPLDTRPLSCLARAFVRTNEGVARKASPSVAQTIRVLLVVSRPAGKSDVPFRSVAARILERVEHHATIRLEILRPPTFPALENALQKAADSGDPYTVLHFDGHGVHEDRLAVLENRPGRRARGYLLFEHPTLDGVPDYVHGAAMAGVLVRGRVPVLIVNACRSAHAEPFDPNRAETRPLGCLADEVMSAGGIAVLAMQYNVDAETAGHFMAGVYESIAEGRSLAEAVRVARVGIFANAERHAPYSSTRVHDWMVPVLFDNDARSPLLGEGPRRPAGRAAGEMPAGRAPSIVAIDDTLMALDRAFQRAPVVVLTGPIGSGKTTVAREFIAWHSRTCGGSSLDVMDDVRADAPAALDALRTQASAMSAAGSRLLIVTRSASVTLPCPYERVETQPLDVPESMHLVRLRLSPAREVEAASLRPLISFSQGNPSVLLDLVTRYAHGNIANPAEVLARARLRPVGLDAGLLDVLRTKFRPHEMKKLALATLFEGVVSAKMLPMLCSGRIETAQPDENAAPLFEQLLELGLVTLIDGNYYRMHPGLPGLLRNEFEHSYVPSRAREIREAMLTLLATISGIFCRHGAGRDPRAYEVAKQTLAVLEPTLWRALEDAEVLERWSDVTVFLIALRRTLSQQRRSAEWPAVAREVWTRVTDPATNQSRPGCEQVWHLLMSLHIDQLRKQRSLSEAATQVRQYLDSGREETSGAVPSEDLLPVWYVQIEELLRMGAILQAQGDSEVLHLCTDALRLAQRVGAERYEQSAACRLALACLAEPVRDLAKAEYWLNYALALSAPFDPVQQAQVRFARGELTRARAALAVSQQTRDASLRAALEDYRAVLSYLLPEEPSDERAACECSLAQAEFDLHGNVQEPIRLLQAALRWYDADENVYDSSRVRMLASRILTRAGERGRARFYALEAARGFARLAPHAEPEARTASDFAEELAD